MTALHLVLLAFAFVLFVLAGIGATLPTSRFQFGWLGLALLTLALWLH